MFAVGLQRKAQFSAINQYSMVCIQLFCFLMENLGEGIRVFFVRTRKKKKKKIWD